MNAEDILKACEDALRANLVGTDVLVGEVPKTPLRPYVVLTSYTPTPGVRKVSGHSHRDVQTVLAMSVNNSLIGCLFTARKVRDVLDEMRLGHGWSLRYSFASAPIPAENAGDYRWSTTADFVCRPPRRSLRD